MKYMGHASDATVISVSVGKNHTFFCQSKSHCDEFHHTCKPSIGGCSQNGRETWQHGVRISWAQCPNSLLGKHFAAAGVSATPRLLPWETLCCYRRERNAPALSFRSTSLPARVHAGEGGALSRRSSIRASTSASTAGGTDGGMVIGFRAFETLTPRHDRLCARCSSIVRFRSCADDSVGAASNYGKAIQSFKDQGVHDPAYVRTLLAPGSGEVQAGNVAKARFLFIESVEAAVKVISSFLLCVIAFANRGAPAILVSAGSSSCSYLSWSTRSCGHS
jgi:hypothetical protein